MNLRGIGSVLGLLGIACTVFILFDRHWQISVPYNGMGQNMQVTTLHQGLWHRCQTTDSLGSSSCDRYYQSIAHLPGSLIGQRALVIIALILGVAGLSAAVASTDTVNVVENNGDKTTSAKTGGYVFIASGLMVVGAVSWASAIIITNSKMDWMGTQSNQGGKVYYTLGSDIYIGWVGGLLSIIAGALLLLGGCKTEDDYDDETMAYNQSPGYAKGYAASNGGQANEYL